MNVNNNNKSTHNKKIEIDKLIKENASLKKKLKYFIEKEKLYKSSIIKIKKYQSDCQKTFIKTLKEYKAHEDKIKKSYIHFQKLLEKHYQSNENRFIEENNSLNMEIRQKNNIIKNLNKKISILNSKLNKVEFDLQIKNKNLVNEVVLKDRQINELNESMIQLARNTNDEIKLLRDEFTVYKNEYKRKKQSGGCRDDADTYSDHFHGGGEDTNYLKVTKRHNSMNNIENMKRSLNNINNNSISWKKDIYKDEDINYLVNRLFLLENQNKNLKQKLKRKEEELLICNNLKNELLSNNNMNSCCSSLTKKDKELNVAKFQTLEKMVIDCGKKINNLKYQYDKSLIRHQNEIKQIKNNYENNLLNNKSDDDIGEDNNNDDNGYMNNFNNYFDDEYFNNYDINELQITNNNKNTEVFMYNGDDDVDNNRNISSEEGIKDEYVNSKLPKINTLD